MNLLRLRFLIKTVIVILTYGSCFDFSPYTNMSLQEVIKEVRDLDNALLDMYETLPKGEGPTMLKYLKKYVQAMKEIVHHAYENKTKVKIEANSLVEQVGPDFLEHPFDKEKIREHFEWESKEYDDMYDWRLKTVKVWNDFHDNI